MAASLNFISSKSIKNYNINSLLFKLIKLKKTIFDALVYFKLIFDQLL